MRIFYGIESMDKIENQSVITLGSFDGVHLGHIRLLSYLRKIANENNKKTLVVTFYPHPQTVLNKIEENYLINTIEERISLIEKSGLIDDILILKFDMSFSQLNPSDFIKSIILDIIKPSHITVGYDTHFGKDRMGDIIYLKNVTQRKDISVDIVEPYNMNEQAISSSVIRKLLRFGKIQDANKLLGYNYFIKGIVIKGEGRGALLGFPTANIDLYEKIKILPQNGVYAVRVEYKDKMYDGVLNIGSRPTFENNGITVEVHILDLNENLYGEILKIYFIARIRDEVRFETNEDLMEQLKKDIKNQKKYQGGTNDN